MKDRKIIDEFNEQKKDEELVALAEKELQGGEEISENDRVIPLSLAVSSDDEMKEFTDMKEYPEDPFTDFETNTVNVQLASASFRYEVTDFILPGRNGFDLKIARRYDSNCANTRDLCTNLYNGNITTSSRDNRHDIGTYGLGYGWSFILPSIESIPHRVYGREKLFNGADGYILHLEDGRSIKIDEDFTVFDDYKLKDIKIITERGNIEHPNNEQPYKGTEDQVKVKKRYHKIIEYKNGTRDYYRYCRQYLSNIDNLEVVPNYKLIARKDRFGNVICFDLTDYGEMMIVDTWGREVRLVKEGDKLRWSLPEGVPGNPISYKILYTDNTYAKPHTLLSVTNQLGQKTEYEYYDKEIFKKKMKLGTDSSYSSEKADRPYLLLKNVKYPNRAWTHFEFDSNQYIRYKDDYDGYIHQFLLLSKSDKIGDEVYNKVEYSYTPAKSSTFIEFAHVTRHDNIKETHEFTKKGLQKNKKIQEKVEGNYVLVSESAYKYDDNKLMTYVKEETYDRSTPPKVIQKETSWTYSSKAEISTETVTYKGDSASDQEITTTYDENYSIPTKITWKKGNVIITETNELDKNKNQVVKCHQIKEGEILKEKTVYDYGSGDYEYCVMSEKKYYTSGSGSLETSHTYAETAYTYDNEKCTHQCVSLSRTDIRDADDKLCSPIQEFFDYDKRGNVIKKTDSKGQITTYQYDNAGRVIKETQPPASGEEVSIETAYNDAGNYITKTDAKRQKVRIEYTKLGQVSKVWLASSNEKLTTDILLKSFEYNSWGELVNVYNYDGNGAGTGNIRSTEESTYDSFGRIVTRSIPQVGYKERYEYDEVCADPEDVTKYYYREQMTVEGDGSVTQDMVSVVFKDQKGQVRKEYLGDVRTASYEYDGDIIGLNQKTF